jgi:hypothetical protein
MASISAPRGWSGKGKPTRRCFVANHLLMSASAVPVDRRFTLAKQIEIRPLRTAIQTTLESLSHSLN